MLSREFTRARGRGSRSSAFVEALESRTLLAGDYSLVFTTLTLPDAVSGFIDKGTAKLTLTNNSNATFTPADKADFTVVIRPQSALDNTSDIVIGTLLNQGVGMGVGLSKPFNVTLTVPANAPIGDYYLLAFANRPAAGPELSTPPPSTPSKSSPRSSISTRRWAPAPCH